MHPSPKKLIGVNGHIFYVYYSMTTQLLISMPFGTIGTGILFLTVVVLIYSAAKAIMRYMDNHDNRKEK